MRIEHRISFNSSPGDQAELAAAGVEVAADGFVTFIVDDTDARWPAVEAWAARARPFDLDTARFTEAEVAAAPWLEPHPVWHHGYPLPEDDYERITYDPSDHCEACGVGLRQVAPFRMPKPKWGRRSILQLNWVFGEYFTKPEHAEFFAGYGIGTREVHTGRKQLLDTVVQLVNAVETVFVSQPLARAIQAAGFKGVHFTPATRTP